MEKMCDTVGIEDNENVVEEDESDQEDLLLLEESDIPGASLNGKQPFQFNVTELKKWLSCHGRSINWKEARAY